MKKLMKRIQLKNQFTSNLPQLSEGQQTQQHEIGTRSMQKEHFSTPLLPINTFRRKLWKKKRVFNLKYGLLSHKLRTSSLKLQVKTHCKVSETTLPRS